MKTCMLALALAMFGISASAQTVKMKKAIKEGDDEIAEQLKKFSEKCGAKAKVTSAHKDAGSIKVEGRDPENIVAVAGKQCGSTLYYMAELCGDADYKAELAKIKEVKCTFKMMDKRPYWIPTKSGTVISFTLHPTTDGSDEGMKALKDLL